MPKEVDPRQARQGRSGARVLGVLVIGLILVTIVVIITELYVFNVSPDEPAPAGEAQSVAPDTPTNETPSAGEARQSLPAQ